MEEMKREKSGCGDEEEGFRDDVLIKIGNRKQNQDNNNIKPGSPNQDVNSRSKQNSFVSNIDKLSMDHDSRASCSSENDQDDQLIESTRAEMGEVREENQRLKMCLDRVLNDYRTLQMQFQDIVRQDGNKSIDELAKAHKGEVEEADFISLSLGRFPSDRKKKETSKNSKHGKDDIDEMDKQELVLGLDCKLEMSKLSDETKGSPNDQSPTNSNEEAKEEAVESWPPSKVLKTVRSGDDEVSQQNPPKKARVCVRARCDTPTMNDGCQWRKYGQKIAKGNPCPRAYYRCTGAPSCPVRKQVQRCADDMSILITTYEGTHNHPLPVSATAMASTTSAAASMLLSGSSTSRAGLNSSTAPTTSANLHGLNFYLSDNSSSKQFYLPNSSISSPTHPTITLDLTSNPSSSSSSSHLNRLFPSYYPPRYPFTNLNFSSSQSQTNLMSWSNELLGYGNQPYNRTLDLGRQHLQNNIYQTYLQKNNAMLQPPRQPLPDTIAAATKAITSDPSFQSAFAAALTSIIGSGGGGGGAVGLGQSSGEGLQEKLEWGEVLQTQKGNGCGSSFMNTTPSTNSQKPNNLIFIPPNSLPFSNSKSASASPGDNKDQAN